MSSDNAKTAYVELAKSLGMSDDGGGGGNSEENGSGCGGGGGGGLMGPVQSTMADMNLDSDPGRQRNFEGGEELFKAASNGDVAAIEAILGSPDASSSSSSSPGSSEVLPVNAKDENGQTALHWACDRGQHAAVELLLRYAGVDVAATDSDAMAALHYAVLNEDFKSASLLLKAGADPAQPDGDGETGATLATGDAMKALFKP